MKAIYIFAFLLIVSAVLHLFWLGLPGEVIFDEVHFGKFVTAYCCTHERFFDIHPPHAKLLIAGTASLFGYDGSGTFDHIGQSYHPASPIPLRIFPALTGILLPTLVFVLLRQLKVSEAGAFLGATVILFDNALTVQTRIIALDGLLLVSTVGALILYFAAVEHRWTPVAWLYFIGAGALAGLAVGTKFTGLVAFGMLGILILVRFLRAHTFGEMKKWIYGGLVVISSGLVVYVAGWAVHWLLLPLPGSGDAWRVPQWDSPIIESFVYETLQMHQIMFNANYGLEAGHQDASKWWTWPYMETSVFYWTRDGASIYFLGNPVVWWGVGALFVVSLVATLSIILQKGISHVKNSYLWIPFMGYVIAYVPLMRVPRALFLYHYLTPMLFSLLFGILWLQERTQLFGGGRIREQRVWYWGTLALVFVGFIFFSPLTYGFRLSPEVLDQLFWFKTWR